MPRSEGVPGQKRPPNGHRPATERPPNGHRPATERPPTGHRTASERPATGHPSASGRPPSARNVDMPRSEGVPGQKRPPNGHRPATERPPTGHRTATPRPPNGQECGYAQVRGGAWTETATERPPNGHPPASDRPPLGQRAATIGQECGYAQVSGGAWTETATERPPNGHRTATHRPPNGHPSASERPPSRRAAVPRAELLVDLDAGGGHRTATIEASRGPRAELLVDLDAGGGHPRRAPGRHRGERRSPATGSWASSRRSAARVRASVPRTGLIGHRPAPDRPPLGHRAATIGQECGYAQVRGGAWTETATERPTNGHHRGGPRSPEPSSWSTSTPAAVTERPPSGRAAVPRAELLVDLDAGGGHPSAPGGPPGPGSWATSRRAAVTRPRAPGRHRGERRSLGPGLLGVIGASGGHSAPGSWASSRRAAVTHGPPAVTRPRAPGRLRGERRSLGPGLLGVIGAGGGHPWAPGGHSAPGSWASSRRAAVTHGPPAVTRPRAPGRLRGGRRSPMGPRRSLGPGLLGVIGAGGGHPWAPGGPPIGHPPASSGPAAAGGWFHFAAAWRRWWL